MEESTDLPHIASGIYNRRHHNSTGDVNQLWKNQPTFLISQAVYIIAGIITLVHGIEWMVQTGDVNQLWKNQPTILISQAVYIIAGIITLVHAFKKGGRWPYFWIGALLHGIYADNFWHFVLPEYDNFWHSQTPIMFLGGRLPLHIILLYPVFMYHAAYAVSKLHLPGYAEAFAVGLVTVLIDLPYDIVAVKFVHWTWHDTDPNINDRSYWVPWNSYYFHATFTASFFYIFNASRRWFAPKVAQWESAGKKIEWKSLVIATLLGMPGGVLLFVPIYHPLHDVYKIHTEVTFFLLFTIYAAFTIYGLLSAREKAMFTPTFIDYILILQLAIHFITYWVFVVWFNPENEVSVGLHEPVGPCNEMANRAEYITVISTILILAASVFYSLYFRTCQAVALARKLKTK
ncbi:Uncharacterized protein OBRU01_03538 [Operophtera brumata]|uniref:DUF7802 domain-containing protein n=1 Tax=Operophtera brumata TaxID=104452 RepID=A0A0L7LF11_OPEBR|nr:Uncharacterized protein OBRU01_03538 [Operophtera brumata]